MNNWQFIFVVNFNLWCHNDNSKLWDTFCHNCYCQFQLLPQWCRILFNFLSQNYDFLCHNYKCQFFLPFLYYNYDFVNSFLSNLIFYLMTHYLIVSTFYVNYVVLQSFAFLCHNYDFQQNILFFLCGRNVLPYKYDWVSDVWFDRSLSCLIALL